MSVCVAVTDSKEGLAALEAAGQEAVQLDVPLVAINLTGSDLDTTVLAAGLAVEVVVPSSPSALDEIEQVLQVLEDRPDITRLVVGVRKRTPVGKAVLGSIPQRLILEAPVPVLSVKASQP
ncbi:Nucleotide-binding universal stress protein, UspA family [Friedmanniella luteola]|uniref:Nucleotide-binding universal stress protein, UspA family n=1 Tax=Friedmanniella luteola TaxID=546871 RepID=A0A1H1LB38_9ACTN|nr:universal stress protein [Friedmanniella luteola]SDR71703.1 Nucleotide-binding universal stress protein, UspA family [Friedmanniella luteola]